MRGRVAAILLLFLLSIPAFPQCNLSPVYSGQFRASILDVTADNNDLWAATSYGVQLFDHAIGHVNHPLAAICADTLDNAQRALALIREVPGVVGASRR